MAPPQQKTSRSARAKRFAATGLIASAVAAGMGAAAVPTPAGAATSTQAVQPGEARSATTAGRLVSS
jgi:hypothetical protein